MADGRLFLACDRCGEQILIFKNYLNPGGGHIPRVALDGPGSLERFIDAHATGWDCLGRDETTYETTPRFSVIPESVEHWGGNVKYFGHRMATGSDSEGIQ